MKITSLGPVRQLASGTPTPLLDQAATDRCSSAMAMQASWAAASASGAKPGTGTSTFSSSTWRPLMPPHSSFRMSMNVEA